MTYNQVLLNELYEAVQAWGYESVLGHLAHIAAKKGCKESAKIIRAAVARLEQV